MDVLHLILAAVLACSLVLWLRSALRLRSIEALQRELSRSLQESQHREAEMAREIEKLSRDHDLFRTLMGNIPDQIYFKDTQSRFLKISQGVVDTLGIESIDAALGKTDSDFFCEADAKAFRADDESVINSGKPLIGRIEQAHVNGEIKWLSTTKAPVFDAHGKVIGLMGISRDITERRKAERELEHERDLLNALMDNMPDEIYFKDADCRFIKANHAVSRESGLPSVIGKTDFDLFPEAKAKMYHEQESEVLRSGTPVIDFMQQGHFGKSMMWISITKVPIRDKNGNIVGLVGINRDITARKRAEDLLRDIIARAECVLWHAEVTDLGSSMKWNFEMLSAESIQRWLGLDVTGKKAGEVWSSQIAPEHLEEMNVRSSAAMRSGQSSYAQEFAMRGIDGSPRWMAESVGVTPAGPGRWHLVGVVFDITERKRAQEALREREYLLRQVLDTNPNLIMVRNTDGKLVLANAALAEFYQTSLEHIIGVTHSSLHVRSGGNIEESAKWLESDREILRTGQPQQLLTRATRTSGRQHWFRTKKLPLTLASGFKAVLTICEDITDLKLAEERLAEERDLLQALMDNVPDNIYFKDAQSRFIRINTYQAYHIGIPNAMDAVGKTDFDFYPVERAREFAFDEKEVLAGRRIINKVERQFVEGAPERWTLTSKVPFFDREGKVIGLVGVSKDITHLKRMEQQLADANEQLNKLAREDVLTGLLNRRMILEIADNEWARWQRYGKTFSLMMIDADDFKIINDTHGHQAGDQALKYISARLGEAIREVDVIGRYGGEEFVIILPETTLEGAAAAAEKVLQNVRKSPLNINDAELRITVSIGLASVRREDKNIDMLLHRADSALYCAKRNGKDQVAIA